LLFPDFDTNAVFLFSRSTKGRLCLPEHENLHLAADACQEKELWEEEWVRVSVPTANYPMRCPKAFIVSSLFTFKMGGVTLPTMVKIYT
jgi:hypothetical protein